MSFSPRFAVADKAYDRAGNVGQASELITVRTRTHTPAPPIDIPQHYDWIRIAELAYRGTPLDAIFRQLLLHSVDLVIPNPDYLNAIHAIAPNTPQLVYTNVSSLYSTLLTDWLNYADSHHVSREDAFYHVTHATYFSGDSNSSQPVNWFYRVYQRSYTNALILYKPLSHATGRNLRATLEAASATTFSLNGRYRQLGADGTLDAVVTRVTLRNGEGAILVKA
jgi:hypothetical protein